MVIGFAVTRDGIPIRNLAGQYIRNNVKVNEIVIGDGEARTRYVLVRNPEEINFWMPLR